MGKNIIGNNALKNSKEIFKSTTAITNGERIVELPLSELYPPEFHPFQVNDDDTMTRLAENIKRYGVREPGLVRPREDGGYELLCGNRRKRACEIAGVDVLPVIIREMDDDNATLAMVDSNLEQREKLLFSEKAWAYRMKLEALNHNGIKDDMFSVDILAEQTGESRTQIFRTIRLTWLVNALLDKVDTKQLAFTSAVELSHLSQTEQTMVASAMEKYDVKPSLSQAQRIKKMKESGELTADNVDAILAENKKAPKPDKETSKYKRFFPAEYTPRQMENVITDLLRIWKADKISCGGE